MHPKNTGEGPNPSGLCMCGCGAITSVSKRSDLAKGLVGGTHVRYVRGHEHRATGPTYLIEDRGYKTPCHVWQRTTSRDGYAHGKIGDTVRRIHIAEWEAVNGPVPEGMQLDHLCRVRACINPEHLEPVTAKVNVQRGLNAVIGADDVRAIRRLYPTVNQNQLAKRFGVSQAQIWRILHRRSWTNIE